MVLLYIAIPFIIYIFIFKYLPLFGWSYAFVDFQPGIPVLKQTFVGLRYFEQLFNPLSGFYQSLRNTLIFSFIWIAITPMPILFAILLSEIRNKRTMKFIQTVTTFPHFISWVLIYSLFFAFFSNQGMVNQLLQILGYTGEPIIPLANLDIVYPLQVALGLWKNLGWSAIVYLAAMAGIDPELYNAAEIDGAGRLRKIIHITIPGIMPTYIVLLILSIGGILDNGFEQYFVFRNPVIARKIDGLDVFIYNQGIGELRYSFATAVGMFKSIVGIILIYFANFLAKKVRGSSIF